ncbi:MFS transporter [Nocardia aurantia]|uniref:Antiseptic resistance protein n=1 Tax=Nocardia aurantia TaxID=2585199 RepID=A0A7K0DKE8_9NOCA|nr:MFS transporter [Nocardia aurantia]MQY26283.1 Antiseptic resistance protein [Nocardia aurantia]
MTSTDIRVSGAAPQVGSPRRAWLGLAVLLLPVLLVSMDVSVLFLAMPTLSAALDPSAMQQLWILDVYGFVLAGLLITMGNLGDRFGRRRILLGGATIFGIGSVLGAFAPSAGVLIAARALMGAGGATLLPSSLALISALFAEPRARAAAIGVWTAFFAGGSAVGPIIGGLLLNHFWWGSAFLVNLPVLVVFLALGALLLPEHRAGRGPLDPISVVLSIGGILPLIYAVKHAAADGVAITDGVFAVIGAGLLWAFLRRQRHLDDPLLDLSLFRRTGFTVAIGSSTIGMLALSGLGYLGSVYLQSVTGRDPLAAAFLSIPAAAMVFVVSMGGARIGRRLGAPVSFAVALGTAAAGNLLMLGIGVDGGVGWYVAGSTIAGFGYGLCFTLVSDVAISAVPPQRAGAAAGISETSFELGNGLGLSLLGSLVTLVFRSKGHFESTLGETLAHGDAGLAHAARAAYVSGVHAAIVVAAGLLAAMAVVALLSARRRDDTAPAPR